jgi:N-acyl-L-homoserine lactone synthetase
MIRFLYADQLSQHPVLADSMFKDRARQFKHRLDWEVTVDAQGWEVDEYDRLNPLYIVWEQPDGTHGGSVRVMPTTGRIMTNEHFLDLTGGVRIASPLIWECTRFCLSPDAGPGVAAALLAAGTELGLRFGLEQALGVIYAKTIPLYRRIGCAPDVIGSRGEGRERISVGLWPVTVEARAEISRKSGIPLSVMARWFDASFSAHSGAERLAA